MSGPSRTFDGHLYVSGVPEDWKPGEAFHIQVHCPEKGDPARCQRTWHYAGNCSAQVRATQASWIPVYIGHSHTQLPSRRLIRLVGAAKAEELTNTRPLPKAMNIGFGTPTETEAEYPKMVTIESKSEPGKSYQVKIMDSSGFAICTCVGYGYRHSCRHTEIARKQVLGESDDALPQPE